MLSEKLIQIVILPFTVCANIEKFVINVADDIFLFPNQHITTTKMTGNVSSLEDGGWDKLRKNQLVTVA